MKVIFRVDASPVIGYGHLVRSLSLAAVLKNSGNFDIVFFTNDYENASARILTMGFANTVIPDTLDEEDLLLAQFNALQGSVVIFDNLKDYSSTFIKKVSERHRVVMVHSYSDGRFYADIALYPAAHLPGEFLHDQRWEMFPVKLISGFEYVLLNEKVMSLKPHNSVNKTVESVVFVAGGSDPSKSLLKLFTWSVKNYSNPGCRFRFLYGQACVYKDEIARLPQIANFDWLPFDERSLENADIVVCAFGVTTYELIYLNIPTLSYGHTSAHANASKRLAEKYGCILDIGLIQDMEEEVFSQKMDTLIHNEGNRGSLRLKCENLIDGKGITRVADEIQKLSVA
jgi:spore coat polysaccharide biosynthesis predicted glycosyltransferase SpsG